MRLSGVVTRLEGERQAQDIDQPRFRIFPVRTTDSPKNFQEQLSSAGELIDGDTTLMRHNSDATLFGQLRNDPGVLWVYEMVDPDGGTPKRAFYVIGGGGLMLGFVRNPTGSGEATPAFKYDVYSAPGGDAADLVETEVEVDYTRCPIDRLAAATDQTCIYRFDSDDVCKIVYIFERLDAEDCPPPDPVEANYGDFETASATEHYGPFE